MASELSMELREYLNRCGLSVSKIEQCSNSTRMYHDLGFYGDIAEANMEVLSYHYLVDLSGFEFERFFPPEFAGKNQLARVLLCFVPFVDKAVRNTCEYLPLTLGMIEQAIRAKRWKID
jgi:hypothetical protein